MPAEKGVRDGHTDALSGTAVLGGEGHFSLLDTVGDRGEGRSSMRGLLDRGGEDGKEEKSREQSGMYQKAQGLRPNCSGALKRDGFLAQPRGQRHLLRPPGQVAPPSLPYGRLKLTFTQIRVRWT